MVMQSTRVCCQDRLCSAGRRAASDGLNLDYHPCIDQMWRPNAAGSTDDTEAIVTETMRGVPGQLLRATFVDFAQARPCVAFSFLVPAARCQLASCF